MQPCPAPTFFTFFLWHSLVPPAQDDLQYFGLPPVWPLTPLQFSPLISSIQTP